VRLSVQLRVPLADVLSWPDDHVRLQIAFLAIEPAPEERLELAIAQLIALVSNRSRGRGEEACAATDFMPWRAAWKREEPSGLTPEEQKMMRYMGNPALSQS
jgi:hypothetical protein